MEHLRTLTKWFKWSPVKHSLVSILLVKALVQCLALSKFVGMRPIVTRPPSGARNGSFRIPHPRVHAFGSAGCSGANFDCCRCRLCSHRATCVGADSFELMPVFSSVQLVLGLPWRRLLPSFTARRRWTGRHQIGWDRLMVSVFMCAPDSIVTIHVLLFVTMNS